MRVIKEIKTPSITDYHKAWQKEFYKFIKNQMRRSVFIMSDAEMSKNTKK